MKAAPQPIANFAVSNDRAFSERTKPVNDRDHGRDTNTSPHSACVLPDALTTAATNSQMRSFLEAIRRNNQRIWAAYGLPAAGPQDNVAGGLE